jgi:hypothetical protein
MADDAYLLDKKTVDILNHVAKKSSGIVVRASVPARRRRGGSGGKSGGGNCFPTTTQSGSNGVYIAKKTDFNTGELSTDEITIFASRLTGYDLSSNKSAVGMEISAVTMG